MFSRFATKLRSFRTYRDDVAQLRAMDDRELADLGIARGDIKSVVRTGLR